MQNSQLLVRYYANFRRVVFVVFFMSTRIDTYICTCVGHSATEGSDREGLQYFIIREFPHKPIEVYLCCYSSRLSRAQDHTIRHQTTNSENLYDAKFTRA